PRVAVAEIIRQDHDDVGSALLRERGLEAKKKKESGGETADDSSCDPHDYCPPAAASAGVRGAESAARLFPGLPKSCVSREDHELACEKSRAIAIHSWNAMASGFRLPIGCTSPYTMGASGRSSAKLPKSRSQTMRMPP